MTVTATLTDKPGSGLSQSPAPEEALQSVNPASGEVIPQRNRVAVRFQQSAHCSAGSQTRACRTSRGLASQSIDQRSDRPAVRRCERPEDNQSSARRPGRTHDRIC